MNDFVMNQIDVKSFLAYKCPFLPNACASALCWKGRMVKPDCARGLGVQALKYAWHAGVITEEQWRELRGNG